MHSISYACRNNVHTHSLLVHIHILGIGNRHRKKVLFVCLKKKVYLVPLLLHKGVIAFSGPSPLGMPVFYFFEPVLNCNTPVLSLA